MADDQTEAATGAAGLIKPLEWRRSEITPWCEDYHTIGGTGYTVRCADENGWKWSNGVGGHGYANFPAGAKAAAQADFETRILSALNLDAYRAQIRAETLEEAAWKATSFLVGDPFKGIPLSSPSPHEIAAAIRNLIGKGSPS